MSGAVKRVQLRLLAASLALTCIATVPVLLWPASSFAEPPTLTITSPPREAIVTEPTPKIVGESSDATVPTPPITVSIYKLPILPGVAPVERMTTYQNAGFPYWSAAVEKPLHNGEYEAIAEQTVEELKGEEKVKETGVAERIFTVEAVPPPQPPTPKIAYPLSGASSVGESQLFSGSASTGSPNQQQVTVEVFSGTSPTPPALRSLSVPVASNGLWNGTVGGLPPGAYTAVAVQHATGKVTGESAPVTFTLTVPVVGPVTPPTAAFTWFPAAPVIGQSVVLVSSSSDLTSPITSFAWDLLGSGSFNAGGPVLSTVFASAGDHTVRLQVADARGASGVASKIIPVSAQPLQPMQPFPIVRIAGVKTSYGVRLSALNVTSPVGVRVTVTCRGRACKKLKPQSRVATASANSHPSSVLLAFRGFQRPYQAGVTLEVRVFAAGEIGKYTSFAIHRHALPSRNDQCLSALDPHPIPCPS